MQVDDVIRAEEPGLRRALESASVRSMVLPCSSFLQFMVDVR